MPLKNGIMKEAVTDGEKKEQSTIIMDGMPSEENKSFAREEKGEACTHALRMGMLCAICGESMDNDKSMVVAALHGSDEILQTTTSAFLEQQLKNELLNKNKKLILILDLDQTILHTTMTESPCDVKFCIGRSMFYVKYRPYLAEFLDKIKELFEIHVYTMGAREYASQICGFIDPTGELFGSRIVSRCENFNELTKSIERITCIDKNVVILDDRIDVWNYSPNLLLVRPFWYFNHLDINNPQLIAVERDKEFSLIADTAAVSLSPTQIDTITTGENRFEGDTNDCELPMLYNILAEVHNAYFTTGLSVPEIIRLPLLKDVSLCSNPLHISIIDFLGGVVSGNRPQIAIEDSCNAKLFGILNLRSEWLYESLYSRTLVDINKYIIEDYRETAQVDEYEKELLGEFFGN